jgi:hypothetical protein
MLLRAFLAACLAAAGAAAVADAAAQGVIEIYKCVDESGRPLYTNEKRDTAGKKCELVSREVNVAPSPPPPKPAPNAARPQGAFPKESPTARANAKDRQRDILEKELAAEAELLAKARQELAQQESVRSGDERNYARVIERLQPYKDKVEVHEKNIEALRRELANLSR